MTPNQLRQQKIERYREKVRQTTKRLAHECGFDVSCVLLDYMGDELVKTVTIEYVGDITFEMLEKLSASFVTRKINIGCDHGTGSDHYHDRYVTILEAPIEKLLAGG